MIGDDLDEIRRVNRARLGLAGYGCAPGVAGEVPGGLAGLSTGIPGFDVASLPSVSVETKFPPYRATWDPGAAQPSTQEGSRVSKWILDHAVRPTVRAGGVTVDLYDRSAADYSDLFNLGTTILVAGTALGLAWSVARAITRSI